MVCLDDRTPVIVGVGQCNHAEGDAPEPVDLLAAAARTAATDSGAPGILRRIDSIRVVSIFTRLYPDPAALVAERLGAQPHQTVATCAGGHVPQWLINQTASDIQAGRVDVVLLGGAESWKTRTKARRDGRTLGWTQQGPDAVPTVTMGEEFPVYNEHETAQGLNDVPVMYSLFENALRARSKLSLREHREHLGRLWSRFNSVATANPYAAVRTRLSAEEISTPGPANRMIAFPYPKLMCSNSSVDQSAAVIMCSVGAARSLGVRPDRQIFLHGGASGSDTQFVSHRDAYDSSAALGTVGRTALELAGVGIDDVRYIDLYSCFPSAVQIAAAELGVRPDRELTVTGGLTFAGGPWNNYTTHAVATLVPMLRETPDALGLCTGNGGMLTKHAIGVYGAQPPRGGTRTRSVQVECDALPRRECVERFEGPAAVETYSVTFDRDGRPRRGHLAGRTADGARTWASTDDSDLLAWMTSEDPNGAVVRVREDGSATGPVPD